MLEPESLKFTVQRLALLEVLRGMQCILDKKNDQESSLIRLLINENHSVLMTISDGSLFLESTIDISITSFNKSFAELYLPVGILYDLTRRLDVTQMELIVSEKTVQVRYNDGDFNLAKITSVANYMRNSEEIGSTIHLPHQQLLDTLRMLRATMAVDDIRDQFRGVSVIIQNNEIVFWSTDGVKMCIAKMSTEANFELQGIWPRKFVDTICTMTTDSMIEIQMSQRQVKCNIGNTVILSPLINAKLLDYKSVFNQNIPHTMKIISDPQYLQKKLDRMMILNSEGSVLFEINDNPSISCTNKQKSDRAFEYINQVQIEGDNGEFFVNPSIMINFLRNFKNTIEILFYKTNNTIIVKKKDDDYPIYITKAMVISRA